MPQIRVYEKHTPRELRDELINVVSEGDANEIHAAVIVLCDLVDAQSKKINELQISIDVLKSCMAGVK